MAYLKNHKELTTHDLAFGIGRKATREELKELLEKPTGKSKPAIKVLAHLRKHLASRMIFLFFITLFNSCATQKHTSGTDISALYNCWVDSREENPAGAKNYIYRPCDFKEFAPSRYRHRIEFKPNGECSSLKLSPTDAHYMAAAKWTYDKDQKIVTVKDETDKVIFQFKIVSLTKDKMEIDKLSSR
jgi:hypothetical protein